jgi:hypothetical protein
MEGKGEEGRGGEGRGPIQSFCPRAQLVVWQPLHTRHRSRHRTRPTGNEPDRAGPRFREFGPARQEYWNCQAPPAGGPARSQL